VLPVMECRVAVFSDPGGPSTAEQKIPKRSVARRRPEPDRGTPKLF
jgi:hypothetical protein